MASHEPEIRRLRITDFPALTADQAAATRLLHDPRLDHWLAGAFAVGLIRRPGPFLGDRFLRLELAAPGGTIQIAVPAEVLPALAIAAVNVVQSVLSLLPLIATRLLAPLLAAAAAAAADNKAAGQRWKVLGIAGVRWHAVAVHGPLPPPLVQWEWTRDGQSLSRVAVLAVDPGCVHALREAIVHLPVRASSASRAWRLGSVLRIATRRVRVGLLVTLAAGDVLLCADEATPSQFDARLYWGAATGLHGSAAVRISERKVILMSEPVLHDGTADSDLDVPGPPLANQIAEVDVPVHFEVDNAALSLGQLASLRPGYVIELSIPVQDAEIRLVACGQIIGRGRLVVIGDCLGVQIEQVAGGGL